MTEHAVDYRRLDPEAVKGKSALLELWEAAGLKAAPARRHSDSPFVGRQRLAALGHQWRRVRTEGAPATALVLAEPGAGKTRLLAAFSEGLGAGVFWGRCLAYGEGGAYAAAAEILAAAGADRTAAASDLDTEGLRTVEAALEVVLGPSAGNGAVGEITKGELHWGICRALELAAATPIAVVFEDLHWADRALLELVGALEDAAAPILILGSARPELLEREPSFAESGTVASRSTSRH